jgi:hypothetical protein
MLRLNLFFERRKARQLVYNVSSAEILELLRVEWILMPPPA